MVLDVFLESRPMAFYSKWNFTYRKAEKIS